MIMNDSDFRKELEQLSLAHQRRVGAAFVRNVLELSVDPAVTKVVDTAANAEDVTDDELALAFKNAKAAALESHTRCGADSDWQAQAGYFVARAASALVAPAKQAKSPAWEAAANARMARTCGMIESADESMHEESEAQYRLLEQFLNDI
ncbi:MAG: hypothetical protein KJ914_15075 [Gammaproteobacteria bacterium]|nr:hypothetical protein [Gammaproteobacteria bacterium]MBU2005951.1 hypothetical protein [Gammaproteobacteria bacterium]